MSLSLIFLSKTNQAWNWSSTSEGQFPQVALIILSMHDEALYAERALRAGARGYVMKHETSESVLRLSGGCSEVAFMSAKGLSTEWH